MSSLNLGSTKGEMSCRCLSGMNGVYYGLKASIFIEVDDCLLQEVSDCLFHLICAFTHRRQVFGKVDRSFHAFLGNVRFSG